MVQTGRSWSTVVYDLRIDPTGLIGNEETTDTEAEKLGSSGLGGLASCGGCTGNSLGIPGISSIQRQQQQELDELISVENL